MYNLHFMVLVIIVVMMVVVVYFFIDNWGHNNWLCIVATVEARVVCVEVEVTVSGTCTRRRSGSENSSERCE